MKKRAMRVTICCIYILALLCSCGNIASESTGIEQSKAAASEVSTLMPVASEYGKSVYSDADDIHEEPLQIYKSEDGLCIVKRMPSYYDITLDYRKGSYYDVGYAYGSTILDLDFDYALLLEPYLFENINMAFPSLGGDYSALEDRILTLMESIPEDYKMEMEGFAEAVSEGRRGISEDGRLSMEEAFLMHMVPDCLRGTNCNAFSVWGSKTRSGSRIASRTLEWSLGSEKQMCLAHAVTHFITGDESNDYMTFSVVGMLDVLTGVSEKGVMAGILDAGSEKDYEYEGKRCYTYELRYALEHMDSARSVGEYMTGLSKDFTFSHNVVLTDSDESLVAEDCVSKDGPPAVLRSADAPLMDDIVWTTPDSMCVINSFVTEGSEDSFTGRGDNYVRFARLDKWIGAAGNDMTVWDVMGIAAGEDTQWDAGYQMIYSDNVFQTVILDYETGEIRVHFTGEAGRVEKPDFINVGSY